MSLQAVVLAGGLGTRLRPVTLTRPKPLIPILNRPLILRVLDILPSEVEEVFIATGYMGDKLCSFFKERLTGPDVEVVVEDRPMGTGGALKNIEDRIKGTFIVINGDVICSLDIDRMLEFHRRTKAFGTIALWDVENPTAYGMIVTDSHDRILRFHEKPRPEEVVSHSVNAGTYILEPGILSGMLSGKETSIEREVFPNVLDRGLYGFRFKGRWFDAGTLDSYLNIHAALMRLEKGGSSKGQGLKTGRSCVWHPPYLTGNDCVIGERTVIGHEVCLGDRVLIGSGCHLAECVLHDGVKVGNGVRLERCLIGENATISDGVSIPPGTIIGDGKVVG
jgi:NDP-sugar pyrophosphorylase family protein